MIRRAYKQHAKILHPDKTGSSDTTQFQTIHRAYEILSDVGRRQHYDEDQIKQHSIHIEINILHSDTITGLQTQIVVTRGIFQYPNGLWHTREETIRLVIPVGCRDKEQIQIPGLGHGDHGVLTVLVHVIANMGFDHRSEDGQLWTRRSISLWEALVGFKFHLRHLSGTRIIVHSDPGRIYHPGDVHIVPGTSTDPSIFIRLEIQFPQTIPPTLATLIKKQNL
jgi:DnaJ-class molecular chaperone